MEILFTWVWQSRKWLVLSLTKYAGIVEGFPVFSFSGENDVREQGQKPSIPYIRTIVKGLRDTFSMTDSDTIDYLLHLRGIEGNYSADDLAEAMS